MTLVSPLYGLRTSRLIRFAAVAILLLSVVRLQAQTSTGAILGTVVDSSGGAVPNAQITITNQGTAAVRNAVSTTDGVYNVQDLPAGNYTVQATAAGFSPVQVKDVVVTVSTTSQVNLKLSVGQVSQNVTVSEAALAVDTTSSEVSTLMDQATIQSIPLNARDLQQLAEIQPGVQFENYDTLGKNIVVAGSRTPENTFLLEGVDMSYIPREAPTSAAGIMLGVAATEEFKVLVDNYSVEYGRHPGGVMNTIVKSGTNSFHGTAYEYYRNSVMDTRNFFDPQSGPPPFRRHQFGGAVGGPVKKDNTFFFFNYEGFRQNLNNTLTDFVPDAAARAGELPCSAVSPQPAACSAPGATSTTLVPVTTSPFIAAAIPVFYPSCGNGPDIGGGICENINNATQTITENFYVAKVDHNFSPNNNVSVFYNWDYSHELVPTPNSNFEDEYTYRRQMAGVHETQIISNTVVNSVLVGLNRTFYFLNEDPVLSIPSTIDGSDPFVLTNPNISPNPNIAEFPVVNVTGLTGLATDAVFGSLAPRWVAHTMGSFDDDLSIQRGKHSLKFGFEFSIHQDDPDVGNQSTRGSYSFLSMQSFLTGVANTFSENLPTSNLGRSYREYYYGLYAEDTYKLKPNLTLTLGLRWEVEPGPTENNNHFSNLINPQSATAPTTGGTYFSAPKHDFGPRVGFNWDPFSEGKTSVRGGFGVYYDMIDTWYWFVSGGQNPPYSTPVTISNKMTWPYNASLVTLSTNPPNFSIVFPTNPKDPVKYDYNLTVQQELPLHLNLLIAYVGDISRHSALSEDLNDYDNPTIQTPSATGNPTYCVQPGQITCLFFPTGLTRPNPNFTTISYTGFASNSDYNSVEFALDRQMAQGLTLRLNYTHLSCMNDSANDYGGDSGNGGASIEYAYNLTSSRGRCSLFSSDAANFSFDYQLPFDRFVPSGWAKHALNGWDLSSLTTVSGGVPFDTTVGFANSRNGETGGGTDRPNLVAGCNASNAINPHNVDYTNVDCFSLPTAGYFGDLGAVYLTGPSLWETDMSLTKNIHLKREGMGVQLQVESFNIFNHTNFKLPGTNSLFTSSGGRNPAAGIITGTVGTSRQTQLSATFNF